MDDETILENLRNQIDNCDKEILLLLKRRMQTAKKIAETKQKLNIAIFQPEREEIVIKNRIAIGREYLFPENFTKKLFEIILEESKKEQEKYLEKKKK